ncbi:MAG: M14 family zinc carboxypeptidase [Bacteroidales bacterium]|nr:M14 family zinc carboxypeptidase [Bacteroidales bacterium]
MKKIFLVLFVFCISYFAFSQAKLDVDAKSVLSNRGEIYFSFKSSPDEIQSFVDMLSVDSYNGKDVKAYANRQQFTKFLETGKEFKIVEDYYSSKALTMATTVLEMANWDRYPTYEVYLEMMQSFAVNYPDICKLDTIGFSGDGRLLLVVKISDNVSVQEAEPEFFYTGMMHGDELVSGMLFLRLIEHILVNYGTDTQITNLVDNVQIFINPFANPDGTYYGGVNTVADSRRNNAANIDLNRNYHDFIEGEHPDGNDYGAETVEFMNYASGRNFVMSANSHSGAELINYPYDTYSGYPADNDWWVLISREYADNAQENSPSGYLTDEGNGVTNGYDWYTATGTRQDYMNYYQHCKELTLELSTSKKLAAEELPNHWTYNKKALLDYLEQVTYGLRGVVTDSLTGEPLVAKVYIEGFDTFNSHVYSFPLHGDYYRLLFEGTYHVSFSCEGYGSKTFAVEINNYEQTILDVQLVDLNDLPPSVNFISNIQYADCNPEIQFINTSEASESTTYYWDFGDGSSISSDTSPLHTYTQNGTYNIKLYGENEHGVDSLWAISYINVNLNELNDIGDYVICETSGSVEIIPDLQGETNWFNSILDESSFHTGETFTTPLLTETTTYYIQETVFGEDYNGGEANNSEGGDYISGTNSYLLFDCNTSCKLETVKVYAENAGTRTIYLKNSEGNTVYNEDFYIDAGEQIVNLNFDLPVGNDYKLGCANPQGLYRGATGILSTFPYPYNIGDVITINQSNVVWWNDGKRYYAHFYDWNISLPDCYSEKTPVTVYINQETTAGFEYHVNAAQVAFQNNSTAADSFVWNFGDETTSSEINPTHTYGETGTFTVKLTASSDCGADEYQTDVFVETGINETIINDNIVFPNPTDGLLNVRSETGITAIKITDISGKIIQNFSCKSQNKLLIDLSDYDSGIYFIELTNIEKHIQILKFIKN